MALRLRHVEIDHIADNLVYVGRYRLQFRAAGIPQKIVEYLRDPIRLFLHNREFAKRSGKFGVGFIKVFTDELEIYLDGRKRILHLVRKAAGEPAQLFDRLTMTAMLFFPH
jgi:hypothetical protein